MSKVNASASERIDVAVDGGSLAAFRLAAATGRDGAEHVLAVHGTTANSQAWLAVARQLAGRAEILAPDIRGRGRSNGLGPPYGMAAHARDMLAVLDHFGLERAVVAGHSLGAYIVARVAAQHPERVRALVLVDGGLTIPGLDVDDPQAVLAAVLGPALARLKMTFPTRQAYRDWWRRHPAFAGSDVSDEDLIAYADHDLVGEEPHLQSAVNEDSVRADAGELLRWGEAANQLTVSARLLCAPRGMLNDPNPIQPLAVARAWAAKSPGLRGATQVPGVNHYTIVMGNSGAKVVADAVADALA